ncbi:MAG: (2Fe-2S)-binding protein [Phycisphaeraceae bacterium]|nr:(2Fe-2S)-binding protein [Phycisphaeraceae bacterium]MCB9847119.1 (2Fe-2S)-binding protein [Phycisphaeraceae bacterium]
MPTITINGKVCEFAQGQSILQVANEHGVEIPQYCYHDGLSVVASCRICLAEVWAPNPRNDNKLEAIPKLLPACQTPAGDGQVVSTQSPKAIANQKSVMELLLINHPLDCPVCDQAGECGLQDYSYEYGRSVSRFEEEKIKQPKKELGPNVLLYSDRCIMCSRCVRFTREVSGTAELMIEGRGAYEQIDVFPGRALDNPIAGNVVDLCPVGALLEKDFLFAKRVWDLTDTPSIDGLTSSGDNIWVCHADNVVHRIKPRTNPEINQWWITDEVRASYQRVHGDDRLAGPRRREHGVQIDTDFRRATIEAVEGLREASKKGGLAALVSPMLSCEEAYALAKAAIALDSGTVFGVGPVPVDGEDMSFPEHRGGGAPARKPFVMRAEKAPNARGVRRVLEALSSGDVLDFDAWLGAAQNAGGVVVTGNYPSEWAPGALIELCRSERRFSVSMDTIEGPLNDVCDVVMPGSTWVEKAGTFENVNGVLQAFERAIQPLDGTRPEGQSAMAMLATMHGERAGIFNAAGVRGEMAAAVPALSMFATGVRTPGGGGYVEADMAVVEF